MTQKINPKVRKILKSIGIIAKTEKEACDKLVAALEKEGIVGMEGESLAALIDMSDGFLYDSDEEDYT